MLHNRRGENSHSFDADAIAAATSMSDNEAPEGAPAVNRRGHMVLGETGSAGSFLSRKLRRLSDGSRAVAEDAAQGTSSLLARAKQNITPTRAALSGVGLAAAFACWRGAAYHPAARHHRRHRHGHDRRRDVLEPGHAHREPAARGGRVQSVPRTATSRLWEILSIGTTPRVN